MIMVLHSLIQMRRVELLQMKVNFSVTFEQKNPCFQFFSGCKKLTYTHFKKKFTVKKLKTKTHDVIFESNKARKPCIYFSKP